MITITNGQLDALGAASAVAEKFMSLTDGDQRAITWIADNHRTTFGRATGIMNEKAAACEIDVSVAVNLLRFARKAYRAARADGCTGVAADVLAAARDAIETAGKCPVMYCQLDFHDGTLHVDYTGVSFHACVHGNLAHWGPCARCGPTAWTLSSPNVAKAPNPPPRMPRHARGVRSGRPST